MMVVTGRSMEKRAIFMDLYLLGGHNTLSPLFIRK